MTRRSLGWALGAALCSCTPIYTEPDAGPPNELLLLGPGPVAPILGLIPSETPFGTTNGPCSVRITNLQVSSSNPDAGGTIVGAVYLNLDSSPPPTSANNSPLPLFSQIPFTLNGPGTGSPPLFSYSPRQLPIVIGLDSLVSFLFPRTDARANSNYLTLRITDGVTTLDLIWAVNLATCDPRPF